MTTKQKSSGPRPLYRTPDPSNVPGAWFDQAAVDKVIKFGRFCRHTKGRWAGRPFEFELWQIEHAVGPAFGWKHPNGLRIIRSLYIEVPKKNGKSTMSSVLGLYLTGPDGEPGAEVYAAAAAKDQARIVHAPSQSMVTRSPTLRKHFKKYANSIVYPALDGTFKVVSADADLQDGLNVHGGVIDEVHRHKNRHLIEILELGTAAREQPLIIYITTAGDEDDTSIYAEKHDYCVKVATGIITDPSFFGVIFGAEPDDDPFTEATQRKANPNYGVTVSKEYLETEAAKAQASPARLNAYLRFHLNIRTKQVTRWLSLEKWDAAHGRTAIKPDELAGQTCYAGLDASRSQEIASFVLDFPIDVERRKETVREHVVLFRFWLPKGCLAIADEATGGMASVWHKQGFLKLTPGDAIDYATIRKDILGDADRFGIEEIGFNRRGAGQLAQELDDDGLILVEMQPGVRLAPGTQEWERCVLSRIYEHGGHPVMRWMVDNLAMKQNADGDVWPDKGKSKGNITGPIAAVMAMDRAFRNAGAFDVDSAIQ